MGLDGGDDNDIDSDLEAELAAIAGGGGKPKPKIKAKPTLVAPNDLDKMIADSLKDVSDDDGEDVENDDELLGELQGIAGPLESEDVETGKDDSESVPLETHESPDEPQLFLPTTSLGPTEIIKQRIEMYKIAEGNAKSAGDSSKARRFGRGLKTLNDLLKQANAGKEINVDDIPPEVSVKPIGGNAPSTVSDTNVGTPPDIGNSVPVRKAPSPPVGDENKTLNPLVQDMRVRQQEYKAAALQSKRSGDTAMALQFLKVVKQFDVVIKMCEDGQEVDLSDMPPPPDQFKEFIEKMQMAAEHPADSNQASVPETTAQVEPPSSPATSAGTMLEALQQRLDKYKSVEESAKVEGNSSKARRFGRIVKQYEDAIKAYKGGRTVAYDELPVPPGFGPLPVENSATVEPQSATTTPSEPKVSTDPEQTNTSPTVEEKKTPPQRNDLTTRTSGNQHKNNLAEQQMKILLERQKEFKLAALDAKKSGEIEQAKEYLKIYKGFDALLNAASSGLPVDLNTVCNANLF